jgi:hypothetical protein
LHADCETRLAITHKRSYRQLQTITGSTRELGEDATAIVTEQGYSVAKAP